MRRADHLSRGVLPTVETHLETSGLWRPWPVLGCCAGGNTICVRCDWQEFVDIHYLRKLYTSFAGVAMTSYRHACGQTTGALRVHDDS